MPCPRAEEKALPPKLTLWCLPGLGLHTRKLKGLKPNCSKGDTHTAFRGFNTCFEAPEGQELGQSQSAEGLAFRGLGFSGFGLRGF